MNHILRRLHATQWGTLTGEDQEPEVAEQPNDPSSAGESATAGEPKDGLRLPLDPSDPRPVHVELVYQPGLYAQPEPAAAGEARNTPQTPETMRTRTLARRSPRRAKESAAEGSRLARTSSSSLGKSLQPPTSSLELPGILPPSIRDTEILENEPTH